MLGCINRNWKTKLMALAKAVRRHLQAFSESVYAVELRASTEGVGTTSEMRSTRIARGA